MGSIIQRRAGIQVINPYVKIANQAFIQQRQMLLEFQCTPASRAKVGGNEIEDDDEDDGDPLA
jgi:phage terminase small subunit